MNSDSDKTVPTDLASSDEASSIAAGCTSSSEKNVPDTVKKKASSLNVNDKLKETFVKHGIALQNEDSLLSLLKDKDFKNLLKARLEDDESSEMDDTEVRMTRSKAREVMQNSPFKVSSDNGGVKDQLPKFTEIPLSEDDEDDEEYKPMESSFESDAAEHHGEPATATPQAAEPEGLIFTPASESKDPFIEQCELHIDEQTLAGATSRDSDIICKRTRSKHSLQATTIDVLEAAFQPPDTTSDMYDTDIGDYDWQQWLVDLMKDGGGKNPGNTAEEDDDPVADPDFSFVPGNEKPDEEDLRDDFSVRVSKMELNSLLHETNRFRQGTFTAPFYSTQASSSLDDSFHATTAKTSEKEPRSLSRKTNWVSGDDDPTIPLLRVTGAQAETLRQQFQQHVQLLVQTNVLCRNQEHVAELVEESSELLTDLLDIEWSQVQNLGISSSAVAPWNLEEAIAITKCNIPPSDASIRLLRMEKIRGFVSIPMATGEVIAYSHAFMHQELLPHSAPSKPDFVHKTMFRPAEDALVALGLAQMSELAGNHTLASQLISQHILPTKTDKQIQARIRNVSYCRHHRDIENPIKKYNSCGITPKPLTNIKHVSPATAKKPIDMEGDLPNWLVALKPVYVPPEQAFHQVAADNDVLTQGSVNVPDQSPAATVPNSRPVVTSTPVRAIMVPYLPVMQRPEPVPAGKRLVPTGKSLTKLLPKQPMHSIPHTKKLPVAGVVSPHSAPVSAHPVTCTIIPTNLPIVMAAKVVSKPAGDTPPTKKNKAEKGVPAVGMEISTEKEETGMTGNVSSEQFLPSSSSDEDNDETNVREDPGYDPHAEAKNESNKIPADGREDHFPDTLSSPNNRKKAGEGSKSSKVRFSKVSEGVVSPPVGGFLTKAHPKLRGRKSKIKSKEARSLRNTAKSIRSLEEDTIVQLDPNRIEKEKIFAMGYHERVQKATSGHPDIYKKFLEILVKFGDGTRPVVELYTELSSLLSDWPDLVQGFAPFLMPEQALECGLEAGQAVYARARKFLRQLEIQFSDKRDHMEKILNVFHTVAGTALYREEEMMGSILNLLKDYPFLQDEFLTFFDDQRPPKVLLEDDFEEVDLTEELMRDPTISEFEQVTLEQEGTSTEPQVLPEPVVRKTRKRRISLVAADESKPEAKTPALLRGKENIQPEVAPAEADDEVALNMDYDTEEEMEVQEISRENTDIEKPLDELSSASVPPDITVISEDAISSSPFRRMTEEELIRDDTLLRPDTPTGLRSGDTRSMPVPYTEGATSPAKSSSTEIGIPATPTGKSMSKSSEDAVASELAGTLGKYDERAQETGKGAESIPKNMCEENVSSSLKTQPSTIVTVAHMPQLEEAGEHEVAAESLPPAEARSNIVWTREIDTEILTSYQLQGPLPEIFSRIAKQFGHRATDIEDRLRMLLSLLTEGDTDNETTSQESEEESETLESDT